MRRPRPKRGERRIDAAINHLAQYGFAKPQIRNVIHDLLQVYGRDGWLFLEEGSYRTVLNKLREEQAQQDQKDLQASANSSLPLERILPVPPVRGPPFAEPPCYGWISEESETESEIEDGEMPSDVARPVIFGKKDIPNPVETLPSKRK